MKKLRRFGLTFIASRYALSNAYKPYHLFACAYECRYKKKKVYLVSFKTYTQLFNREIDEIVVIRNSGV